MYERILKYRKTENLSQGIDVSNFTDLIYHKTEYKHGRIEDLRITPVFTMTSTGLKEALVMSRDATLFIQQWRKLPLSGQLVIEHDNEENRSCFSIEEKQYNLYYECDSRKIFKTLNDLSKTIVGAANLSGKKLWEGHYSIPTSHLMAAVLLDDTQKAVHMLRSYSVNSVYNKLKTPEFKHYYKIIHPDTNIIEEKI